MGETVGDQVPADTYTPLEWEGYVPYDQKPAPAGADR